MRALAFAVAAASLAVGLSACPVEVDGAVGRTCQTAFDCPPELTCVQARAGEGKTCEALALPATGSFETDAGVAYYCDGVKPILDAQCLTCHGPVPAGGAPGTFRLDTYEATGGKLGVKDKAATIYTRSSVTKDMPPGSPLPAADQQTITAWFKSGAQFCADAGADAGQADGGDGGP